MPFSVHGLQKDFDQKKATKLLKVLLLVDLLFIAVHITVRLMYGVRPNIFLLDAVLGFPEFFQYMKYVLLIYFTRQLVQKKKEYAYAPFMALFLFLLADDAFQIHNRVSGFFVHWLNLPVLMGLRQHVLGQIIFVLVLALVVTGVFSYFFLKAPKHIKPTFIDVFLLVGLFLVFGIGVDLVHGQLMEVEMPLRGMTVLEEGGEMLTLSLLVWYFCFLVLKQGKDGPFLYPYVFRNKRNHS